MNQEPSYGKALWARWLERKGDRVRVSREDDRRLHTRMRYLVDQGWATMEWIDGETHFSVTKEGLLAYATALTAHNAKHNDARVRNERLFVPSATAICTTSAPPTRSARDRAMDSAARAAAFSPPGQARKAYLAELRAAGFAVVPINPSVEMEVAGTEAWLCVAPMEDRAAVCYRAMVGEAEDAPDVE
ncbi:hypothetical protein [Falsiroseomonas sp.]|uniref:hypothetical protein n=1 Tax=Falsiroseomonas sp. TaxID=2870721 RepID=UPI00273385DB|nr:hypothetical protein [Falsiroseomonas sp.]MDP3417905.1 hypothetical protein [Falsiroseomonas sp.]